MSLKGSCLSKDNLYEKELEYRHKTVLFRQAILLIPP